MAGKLANSGNKNGFSPTPTEGNDKIISGAAVINALGGNDIVYGTDATQSIDGGSGNDWINGGGGADTLDGGAGNDWVSFQAFTLSGVTTDAYSGGVTVDLEAGTYSFGSSGSLAATNFEKAWGSSGGDSITGSSGENNLKGGAGVDTINGAGGNDEIEGGAGNDILDGGAGNDTYVFTGVTLLSNGTDTIATFEEAGAAGGDTLQFSLAAVNAATVSTDLSGGALLAGNFVIGTPVAGDNNDYFIYNDTTGELWFDRDGSDGAYSAELLATLSGDPDISAGDIWLA